MVNKKGDKGMKSYDTESNRCVKCGVLSWLSEDYLCFNCREKGNSVENGFKANTKGCVVTKAGYPEGSTMIVHMGPNGEVTVPVGGTKEEPIKVTSNTLTISTDGTQGLKNVYSPEIYLRNEVETVELLRLFLSKKELKGYIKGCVLRYTNTDRDSTKAGFYYDLYKKECGKDSI